MLGNKPSFGEKNTIPYRVGEVIKKVTIRLYNNTAYMLSSSVTFPFTCADFATELAANSWLPVSESIFDETLLDGYNGTRLEPSKTSLTGFHVQSNNNFNNGFSVFNDNDTGNAAQANITVKGPGALYSNNTGISHYGAGYYVTWCKSSGLVYSDKVLNFATWNNNDMIWRTGATFAGVTEKLRLTAAGTLKIGVTPATDNTASVLGRNAAGNITVVDNVPKINQNSAPSSATDTGTKGEIRVPGDGFIYFCYATNLWTKVAETAF